MSGRIASFARKGSRAEKVADLLLSSMGVCSPVRREDDYGVDFHCELGDEQGGFVSYHSPFIIQVKSNVERGILYGATDPVKWTIESTSWLFRNKIPFFIGAVNLEALTLSIYDTTGLWQVYNRADGPVSQIEFAAKPHPPGEWRGGCQPVRIEGWMPGKGDGMKYIVDLGNPVAILAYKDLDQPSVLDDIRAQLTAIIGIEQKNILNRDLRLRIFTDIKETNPPGYDFNVAWSFSPHSNMQVASVLKELEHGLISVLIKLNSEERREEIKALKTILKMAPRPEAKLADALVYADPRLFDYLKLPTDDGASGVS